MENDDVVLRNEAVELIQTLDQRGILQSVASKNDHNLAIKKLETFGLAEYFLYPQINWNPKSESLRNIASSINIGLDTVAFIDDQAFERDEVRFVHPDVLTIDSTELHTVAGMDAMIPRFITDDARNRRLMYQSDIIRKQVEDSFEGSQDVFLSTLGMKLTINPARPEDLKRAEELTQRTNQLNTTAYTYDYDELEYFSRSDNHLLLVAGLNDRYGTYGKIGLTLVEKHPDRWVIKLLLMSCRVMSRGVGTVIITYLRNLAKEAGVRLTAEFVSNERNRMMYITYKFNQFRETETNGSHSILENDLTLIPDYPAYMELITSAQESESRPI